MVLSVDVNDKRVRIMMAAAKVFAHNGFHRAKMEEVAREADVGKGTVYEYFSSKEQLFIEMFKAGKDYYLDVLVSQLKNKAELYDQLKKVAYLHLAFFHEHKDMARVMMQEFLQLGADLQEVVLQIHEQEINVLDEIFQQGVQEGYFRQLDTKLAARIFYGSIHAMLAPMIFYGERPDPEKLSGEIVDIFLRGIKK